MDKDFFLADVVWEQLEQSRKQKKSESSQSKWKENKERDDFIRES